MRQHYTDMFICQQQIGRAVLAMENCVSWSSIVIFSCKNNLALEIQMRLHSWLSPILRLMSQQKSTNCRWMMLLFDQSPAATVHTFISPWNLDHELLAFFWLCFSSQKGFVFFCIPCAFLAHIGHFEKRIFFLIQCLNFASHWYKCAEDELTFLYWIKI